MAKYILYVFISCFIFSEATAQELCDSMPITNTTEWNDQGSFISTFFFNNQFCESPPTNKFSHDIECNPCILHAFIEGKSENYYLVSEGLNRENLYINGTLQLNRTKTKLKSFYTIEKKDDNIDTLVWYVYAPENRELSIAGFNKKFDFSGFINQSLNTEKRYWTIRHIFFALLLTTLLFNIISFLFTKRSDYIWYSLYIIILLAFFWIRAYLEDGIFIFNRREIQVTIQPLVYVFYLLFIIKFLDLKNTSYKLYNLVKIPVYFLSSVVVVFIICIQFDLNTLYTIVWNTYRIAGVFYSLFIIYLLFKLDNPLKIFIIYGSLSLAIGSALAIALSHWFTSIGNIAPIEWMIYGTMLEVSIFSAGIAYRSHLDQLEKVRLGNVLIQEMKKNEILQNERQTQLEKEVEVAGEKIKEEERKKLKAEYELLLRESEMQLLRTQMNPHFLFNSLNSIKSYIAKNEPRVASNYLNKFASLVRLILNNSKEKKISLSEELRALSYYIDLEKMRLNNGFEYILEISPDVNVDDIQVPPLIIQPYVENAIWHGLANKPIDRKLTITLENEQNKNLKISIRDNGIGRKASKLMNPVSKEKNKSHGMNITKNRLELSNSLKEDQISVEIIDLYNHSNQPIGTEIVLKLSI